MSKWTDVRDNIVDALNVDVVTGELKDQVTQHSAGTSYANH